MSSKRSRVHPKYKTKYRVTNWASYDRSLVRRGDVTLWFAPEAIDAWNARPTGRRGAQRQFSDTAIETALSINDVGTARKLLDRADPVRVDGTVAAELGLPGKPAPDTFLEAALRLDAPPERAVVVEDAISGVQAEQSGGFGLVIGIGAGDQVQALLDNGADLVVADLAGLIAGDETP